MSELKIVNTLDQAEWRRFVLENPNGNIFHSPEMFQVFEQARGFVPQLWAAVNDLTGKPLALLLPVQIPLMSGVMRHFTTRAVVYGSVLWEPGEHGLAALDFLLAEYARNQKNAPIFTELRNIWEMPEALPVLQKRHFVYEAHLNYIIDLYEGPEAVLKNIGSRTRKNIRHGLNKGEVLIDEITRREELDDCYGLLQMTYQNAQVPLADRSLFEAAFDVLLEKGMIRFARARVGDANVATSVELLYKDVVYGWYGGVDREFSSYTPNELIMWNVLEWSSKQGYRYYDFGGAGKPDEKYGVRDFKAKFGGRLVSYGRNVFVHKPAVLFLSKIGYQVLRRWL
jgi:CelD/BcsL family acetyltransferase involved in cellulose biosynthesis